MDKVVELVGGGSVINRASFFPICFKRVLGKVQILYKITLAMEMCFICSKLFYSDEDLDKHKKLEIHCSAGQLCTTADNFEFNFCAAMGHLAGELKLDEVMKKFSEVPI